MVYAAQLYVGFRNTARRDGVLGNLTTKFASVATWGETVIEPVVFRATGDPGLMVSVRCTSKADRDQFIAEADSLLGTGTNGPVAGSRLVWHDCDHDIPNPLPCVVDGERLW